jgi:hypothetical protein
MKKGRPGNAKRGGIYILQKGEKDVLCKEAKEEVTSK